MSSRILLRASSGPAIGMGHAMRTRAVAQALAARGERAQLVVDDAASAASLGRGGVEAEVAAGDGSWARQPWSAAWLDGFRDWSVELEALAKGGARTLLVENRGPARERADLVIYPALHHAPDAWDREHPERVRGGAAWIPLAREVLACEPRAEPDLDLLVSFGGSDPQRLTERCARVLATIGYGGRTALVLGPHMGSRRRELEDLAARLPRAEVLDGAAGLAPLMARAALALTALATTLYELAHLGVPALILANYERDGPALAHYLECGPHRPLGIAGQLDDGQLSALLGRALADPPARRVPLVAELAGGADRLAGLLLGEEQAPGLQSRAEPLGPRPDRG